MTNLKYLASISIAVAKKNSPLTKINKCVIILLVTLSDIVR